jgi:large subunit ribosomal protein L23
MKLKPLFTEKTMKESKQGGYTFLVDPSFTKGQIKSAVNQAFGVHVVTIHTINKKSLVHRGVSGKIQTTKAIKKAIVTLREKEKIELFEEKEKRPAKGKGKKS